jgi:hypothetical protein
MLNLIKRTIVLSPVTGIGKGEKKEKKRIPESD